jgi:hypothetical protein
MKAFSVLFALLIVSVASAVPTAPAVRRQGEVKVDGVLDEAGWQAAAWQTGFVSASSAVEGKNPPAAVQTRFKVLFDDDALYVGVECDEPNLDKLVARYTEHDQDVYRDDCVEVFFDPAGEGRYYHHFVVNTKGAWYDDTGADYGLVHAKLWEFPLQVGTQVDAGAKQWRVEMRIPFAGLDLRGSAKADWLFNVTRERYAGGGLELSTWSPLKGNFHAPRLFGKLTGVSADFRRLAWTIGAPQVNVTGDGSGRHLLRLRTTITNGTGEAQKVVVTAHPFLGQTPPVKSEVCEVGAGAAAAVELPALKVAGNVREAIVQINVLEVATGAPLRIAVKHLDSEYRPIALDIIKPNYRQNIYATENVPELVFQVKLAPDVAAKTAQVAYSLHDGADKSVREGKAKAAQLEAPLKLEVGKLPPGVYTLKARAVDQGDATIVETQTTIRKLIPAAGSEVRVDELGNVVVNGKPHVFIGWYGNVPLEDPRPEVIALQDVQTPVVLQGLDPKPVRDSFAKGIYSVVSIEPGRMYYTFNWWRDSKIQLHQEITKQDAPSEEFLGYLRQLVNCVKDEPGLLGYYLADEPEINNARSSYMEAIYRVMQELDPYHPVTITNDMLDGIVTHGYRACDILNPDPYSPEPEYVPNFMKRCREVMGRGQAIMMTPWASSGEAHFTTAWGTAPPYPYRVMRTQYLAALALGCKGFTGYTTPFFMPEIELRYGLPHIWREVRLLEPALANPTPRGAGVSPALKVEADAEMIAWSGTAAGATTVIVVNHKPGRRTAKISDPGLARMRSVTVVSEGRSVPVNNGVITDQFGEGEAHIYSTSAAGRSLPTMAAIEKELADRKAASVKPGNLLHNSLGIRARASEGFYAPWFSQFYYYAMNGITDDQGWYLSHTDKPSWLEITLPQARSIGRIVVYSPNLKDYDLQLQGPDGKVQVAEVRGSDQAVAEHTFQPAIPTLKLRVTALGVRDGQGTAKANLAEIEAYEAAGTGAVLPVKVVSAGAPEIALVAPKTETEGEQVLWREDFAKFQLVPKFNWDATDVNWVGNADKLFLERVGAPVPGAQPGGGLVFAANAAEGYAGMSHYFAYDPQYRYLQVSISKIEGEGYKWAVIGCGDGSGKLAMRTGVHTLHPGLYTVDTHYVNEGFRTGSLKRAYVTISGAGSGKNADGSMKVGPKFTYDFLQLVRRPTNGLIVTMADGSPVPAALKQGDTLLYRVYLEQPAQDVTVETQAGPSYTPLPINREPSVQLQQVGAKDGREWAAQVTLGPGTGKFEPKGYPVLFRAVVTGGAIAAAMVTMAVKFE